MRDQSGLTLFAGYLVLLISLLKARSDATLLPISNNVATRRAMTRYAIYFAPERVSPWWQIGCRWLGRDPEGEDPCSVPSIFGIPASLQATLTHSARRYGFHATLKAPFRLARGFDEIHLLQMAQAFARHQSPIEVRQPEVQTLGAFLALQPAAAQDEINALAMRCVSYFDLLRAPLSSEELARRRHAELSPRQQALLLRWGYPFTEEAFRFHMTLSDSLTDVDAGTVATLRAAAKASFAGAIHTPLIIDGLAIFREAAPGDDFELIARARFASESTAAACLPSPGRLFFMVGPSGSGKDTLLRWLATRLPPSSNLVFARRIITRPADESEASEFIDEPAFWRAAAAGEYAMQWRANGLCYAIRRGIDADLRAGRDVIVNGSREYIAQLRQAYPTAQIVWIEAGIEQIRRRIVDRRRESGPALLRRLERVTQFTIAGNDVVRIDNNEGIEQARKQLLSVLLR